MQLPTIGNTCMSTNNINNGLHHLEKVPQHQEEAVDIIQRNPKVPDININHHNINNNTLVAVMNFERHHQSHPVKQIE